MRTCTIKCAVPEVSDFGDFIFYLECRPLESKTRHYEMDLKNLGFYW